MDTITTQLMLTQPTPTRGERAHLCRALVADRSRSWLPMHHVGNPAAVRTEGVIAFGMSDVRIVPSVDGLGYADAFTGKGDDRWGSPAWSPPV